MKRCVRFVVLSLLLALSLLPVQGVTAEQGLKTITVFGPVGQQLTYEEMKDTATWQYLVDLLAARGVQIEVNAVASDQYATVLQAYIASGKIPDFFSARSLSNANCVNLIDTGKILSIDDILQYSDGTAAQSLSKNGLYYVCREKDTYSDGKLYYFGNVSMLYSVKRDNFGYNAITSNQYGMKIRQDWLEKLNLPMPQTPDEFYNALVAFRENDMNENGLKDERMVIQLDTCNSSWGGFFDNGVANWFGLANYVSQLNRNTWQAQVPFLQEGFIPYVQFLKKCIAADVLYLSDSIGKNNNALSSVLAQNVVSAYLYQATSDKYSDASQVYTTMPLIQALEGVEPVVTGSVGYKAWDYWGFSKQCDPEAAAALLDVLLSTEYSIWYQFGPFEGETYEINNGVYKRISSTKKEEYMKTGKMRGYECVYGGFLPQPSLSASFCTYNGESLIWDSYEDFLSSAYYQEAVLPKMLPNRVESLDTWIKNAESVSTMYNMNGDLAMIMPLSTAEEADTLSFYENELYTYMNELFANLIAGNYSLDDYAGYVEQMNDLGLEKVLAIYQGMYDRLQH